MDSNFKVNTQNNIWVDIHCIRTDVEWYSDIDFLNEFSESELKLKILRDSEEWAAKLKELEDIIEKQNPNNSFFKKGK